MVDSRDFLNWTGVAMRKFILPILTLLALVMIVLVVKAAPQQFIGSLTTVNTTTNYTATGVAAFTSNPTLQQATVTHTALTNLTSLSVDIFVNVRGDVTNGMIKVGTWTPSNTNACTEVVNLSQFFATNYVFFGVGTTNNVGIGGTYGN